jgi:hypothetical protein
VNLKKELERASGSADKFSYMCDMYNFVQFVTKYVPSYAEIKYDDDGYLIINDDMKSMSKVKAIHQQRNYQKYDTLVCTEVLNSMFKTNLNDLMMYAHSRQITEAILSATGVTYEMIQEYESHPWYYHKWHMLKTKVHCMYLSIKYMWLKLITLRLKITIAIRKIIRNMFKI